MPGFSLPLQRVRASGDSGIALIVALAVMGLATILMLTMVTYVLRENGSSGRERQRAAGIMTAEGDADLTIAQVQSAPPASLPCGAGVAQASSSGRDATSTTVTVNYYDASGALIPCASLSTTQAATARILSTTTSAALQGQLPVKRTFETELRLTPKFANGMDKAIFANAGIALSNNGEVYGQGGRPDADIYTNGNFSCANNQHYHGSIYAQGSISLSSTCLVDVDAYAKTGFSANNTGVNVLGRVLVSNGNASVVANAKVGQTVRASGTISWADCTAQKCFPGSSVAPPPYEPFPVLNWDATTQAAWVAAGYTIITPTDAPELANCTDSGNTNGPGNWLMTHASTVTTKTLVRTPCRVDIGTKNNVIVLNSDVAMFADQGFYWTNSLTVKSTTSDVRVLHLVQPYNSSATPCNTTGIYLDNRVTIESTVNELLYTPCNITKSNNADHYGQIYAGGTASIDNKLTMFYKPVPVFGVVAPTANVELYNADILYKREVR